MAGHTDILWVPMVDLTMSAVMAGLTYILWAPMVDLTVSAAIGRPQ